MHEILKINNNLEIFKFLSHPCQMVIFPATNKRAQTTGGRMAFQSARTVYATVQQTDSNTSNIIR